MAAYTIFSWGYYGWGNCTSQLVQAVDAVERNRGFDPPIFVDIRIRRSVRAVGFTGPAFEKLLGHHRHRWMKSLGNKFIETRTGPAIQISDPSAAEELLELAIDSSRNRRRLLFFCSCQWPQWNGRIACHRAVVARLVLKAAKKRGVQVEVVEWPGGEPKHLDLDVAAEVFRAVQQGRVSLPIGKRPDLAEVASLPWCSTATLHTHDGIMHRVVGPVQYQSQQWSLPILSKDLATTTLMACRKEADRLRTERGLSPNAAL